MHHVRFRITELVPGQVRFTHVGLVPEFECYDVCSDAWAGLISTDLPDLITTRAAAAKSVESSSSAQPGR